MDTRTRSWAAGLVVVLILISILALNIVEVARGWDELLPVTPGSLAPAFQLPALSGEKHSLERWRGKVVLISFWATWCKPCMKELPLLSTLQQELGPRGLQVLSINIEGDITLVKRALAKVVHPPIVLLDQQGVAQRYGVSNLPHLVLVSRGGKVLAVHSGMIDEKGLRRWISSSL